jgi:hypothetical protein
MSSKPNTPEHPKLDFLPESVIALYREIQVYHQYVFKKYANLAGLWGTPESIGILAAEVSILMNNTYNDKQIDVVCGLILKEFVVRREPKNPLSELIVPDGTVLH